MFLTAFNESNKDSGFYRLNVIEESKANESDESETKSSSLKKNLHVA